MDQQCQHSTVRDGAEVHLFAGEEFHGTLEYVRDGFVWTCARCDRAAGGYVCHADAWCAFTRHERHAHGAVS